MTATGHAVIGVVIAAKIGSPVLAIPIAFASHCLADMFPHWDTATNVKQKGKRQTIIDSAIDVFISFLATYFLVIFVFPETPLLYAYIIVFASQALDWLMAPYYFFRWKFPPFYWAYRFQKDILDHRLDKPWGIINQVAVLVALVVIAKLI